jgi:pilus assembly protein CpaF
MFGKRDSTTALPERPAPATPPPPAAETRPPPKGAPADDGHFNEIKVAVFGALLDAVDLKELGKLTPEAVREELTDIISEIVNIKRFVLTPASSSISSATSATTFSASGRSSR